MADFLTRLAKRALGVAPVVQPLITPRFAPEPNAFPPELEPHVEVPTPPGASKETQNHLSHRAPRTGNTRAGKPEYGVKTGPEIGSDLDPSELDLPRESADLRPEPHSSTEPGLRQSEADAPSSPGQAAPGSPPNEPRSGSPSYPVSSDASSTTPESWRLPASTAQGSRQTLDTWHESRPLAEPDPTESGGPTDVSHQAENVPDRTVVPPAVHLAERPIGAKIAPKSVTRAGRSGIETPSVTSAPMDRERRAPGTGLSEVGVRPEGGLREKRLASSPETQSPTVHVNIGRIEVRAVTPPPAPPRRQVEPSAKLSLDDYLRQRGGKGRR